MTKRRPKRWIKSAIRRPGALTAVAKRVGALTKSGTIKVSWLREQARKKGTRGRQARLALTMRKMKKR